MTMTKIVSGSPFSVYIDKEGWRACELLRVITRGKNKGKVQVRVPRDLNGWKKHIVPVESLRCVCCGLRAFEATAFNHAGKVHLQRKPRKKAK